ncbi:serine hydrolase [Clostridium estertheticum]|uniref:serine hydrolase n=1 Tax=Clostridium estertheticum TaxID=238834 RepID=UPI001C7D2377|nr:serine hydrolase [Clostridium estertheticum]MBX4262092.1 serine hydrolase [Clostridium estertheticum]WLC68955.1 serine hydrolase [Clostridium estertheticum]
MKEKIRNICDDFSKKHNFSGTCLVKQVNDVIFSHAYGLAHRGFNIPNKLNTMFDTASITKVFTATTILILIEKISGQDYRKFVTDNILCLVVC